MAASDVMIRPSTATAKKAGTLVVVVMKAVQSPINPTQ